MVGKVRGQREIRLVIQIFTFALIFTIRNQNTVTQDVFSEHDLGDSFELQ